MKAQESEFTTILRRQQQVNPNVLPTTYAGLNEGPAPGTVAGIVLGSVAGFLLLLWLIYTCFNFDGSFGIYREESVRRRSRSPRRSSRSRSEVIEVSRQRSPRREVRRETVVVEETTRRTPPERDDDIVEVIEEHSPRRERRGSDRRDSGGFYRTVDPDSFAGGRAPPRKVRR